ncbi:unnamed protein product [Linum trigynum]|uniref:Cystatin domain-containing protein n=1 Tax=Linum trigynum TaxID=586398 RepID=A0AAV2C8D6_9ROSI
MNPDAAIPSLRYDPHSQTPLLPTDVSSSVVVESAPGSGSSSSETELDSNPKRQKIDEDDGGDLMGSGGEEDEEEEWSQTMGEPLTWYPKSEEDRKKMALYYEQVFASEGFDYVQQPPVDVLEYGVLHVDMEKALCRKILRECVDHVVKETNKSPDRGWKLVAGDIVKANWRPVQGGIYFITFMAKNSADPKDAAEKEYEAQVYRNFTGVCEMELFRVKGQKEAIQESPDRWRMIMCNGWPCDSPCGCCK